MKWSFGELIIDFIIDRKLWN